MLRHLLTTGRIVLGTMVICSLLYSLAILGIGQLATPGTANGWLVRNEQGQVVGSEIVGQGFSHPGYFWPRPSAVGYDAAGSGGSNLSPTNSQLRSRALDIMEKYGEKGFIPADLVTASGSGLDPHITLKAAKYQVDRVAKARGFSRDIVLELLERFAFRTGGVLNPEPLVNVLLVNLELDKIVSPRRGAGLSKAYDKCKKKLLTKILGRSRAVGDRTLLRAKGFPGRRRQNR